MHFQNILVQITSVLLVTQGLVHAQPGATASLEERAKDVPCDDISKYTVAWFRGSYCKRPPASTCLFYTRGLSKTAKVFSKEKGDAMTTIWELWPKVQYNRSGSPSNPLRCIFAKEDLRLTYFSNMSEAMASFCDIFATVMDPNVKDVRMNGIWGKVEFPTLQRSDNDGKVLQVEAMSPDGKEVEKFWTRGKDRMVKAKRQGYTPVTHVARDDTCGADDDTAAAFDVGGEFPVDW